MLRRISCLAATLVAALVLTTTASAHKITGATLDCFTLSGSYTGFQAGDTVLTLKGEDTLDDSTVVTYTTSITIHGYRGPFGPVNLPAPAGTTQRKLTITWTVPEGPGTLVVGAVKVNCPRPVTPPVAPPVVPPVVTPPAPPAFVTPPATTPAPPTPPPASTPKVYKPILTLNKAFDNSTAFAGSNIGSHLHYCNKGRADAHDVVLIDSPSKKMTIVGMDGGTARNGHVRWFIGTLKAGQCGDFHPLLNIDNDARGTTCNWGSIQASDAKSAADHVCLVPKHKQPKKLPPLVTG